MNPYSPQEQTITPIFDTWAILKDACVWKFSHCNTKLESVVETCLKALEPDARPRQIRWIKWNKPPQFELGNDDPWESGLDDYYSHEEIVDWFKRCPYDPSSLSIEFELKAWVRLSHADKAPSLGFVADLLTATLESNTTLIQMNHTLLAQMTKNFGENNSELRKLNLPIVQNLITRLETGIGSKAALVVDQIHFNE